MTNYLRFLANEIFRHEAKLSALEREIKDVKQLLEEAKKNMIEEMEADDLIDTITIDGVEFKCDVLLDFIIDSGNWEDERFFKWIIENGLGDVIKTERTVEPQLRKKILREVLELGGDLPPFIRDIYEPTVKYDENLAKIKGGIEFYK